jgi:mitochondrial translocator assembly and maintenance protein 41
MDSSSQLPMVDLIFVVENSESWHEKNMILNPSHYTTLFPLKASWIATLESDYGAGIWYNAMVPMRITRYPHRLMKYGVISRRKFLEDMLEWKYLYVAGRLHKPVQILKSQPHIKHAMERNRENAILTSLLLLPPRFTESDLFLTIAGLSYIGDPRMKYGENPKKVMNLVSGSMLSYRLIYSHAILSTAKSADLQATELPDQPYFGIRPDTRSIFAATKYIYQQDSSAARRWILCESLPKSMKSLLLIRSRSKYLRERPPKRTAIRASLSTIVAKSATTQSIKGLVSAGLVKCSLYIFSKLTKRFSWLKPSSAYHTSAVLWGR